MSSILLVFVISAIACVSAESANTASAPPSICLGLLPLFFMLPFMLFSGVWMLAFGVVILSIIGLVLVIIDITRREFPEENTRLLWILIVLLTGIIGVVLYYILVISSGKYPKKPQPKATS